MSHLMNLTPLPYNLWRRKGKARSKEKPEQMFEANLHHFTVPVMYSLPLKMNLLFIWTKTTSLLEIGTVCSQIVKSTSLLGTGSGDMSSPSTWGVGSTICLYCSFGRNKKHLVVSHTDTVHGIGQSYKCEKNRTVQCSL